jgi:hypothetical protein
MDDIIYSWSFSNEKNRWSLWYIIALSVVIWLVVWWFLTRQYVMSFLIILITWVTFFVENNSEEVTQVFITNLWIKVNSTFYDFSKIASYSFIYDWENAIFLRLSLLKKWIKFLDLDIDNNIALDLKSILPNFLKEDRNSELTFTDKIIRMLKL